MTKKKDEKLQKAIPFWFTDKCHPAEKWHLSRRKVALIPQKSGTYLIEKWHLSHRKVALFSWLITVKENFFDKKICHLKIM